MRLVLSGTVGLVLSGTRDSSYQELQGCEKPQNSAVNGGPSNYPNITESYGFFLTVCAPVDFAAVCACLGGCA
ncbi:hypothetical protein PP1Y_Lpl168 (plasmid) [Novosphingobium sp. PP1Y]|nr:hypothetical protein PP1Y_Lpl168 [Novosphingobium sp. PP1Y]